MKKVNVSYGWGFNQFSFSQWDTANYENYKGFPVKNDNQLITGFNLINDIPIYEFQLKLISEGLDDCINNFIKPDFKFELSLEYNNYGSLFLVWTTKRKNLDKIIELHNDLIEGDWCNGSNLEDVVNDFNDFQNFYDFDREYDSDDEKIIEYVSLMNRLGYKNEVEDIAENIGIGVDIVRNYFETLQRMEKYNL